jgi:hypothetical protein
MQLTGKDPYEGKGMTDSQAKKMKQFLIQRYGKGN